MDPEVEKVLEALAATDADDLSTEVYGTSSCGRVCYCTNCGMRLQAGATMVGGSCPRCHQPWYVVHVPG